MLSSSQRAAAALQNDRQGKSAGPDRNQPKEQRAARRTAAERSENEESGGLLRKQG